MANSSLPRRIIKETQRLLNEPAPGINASPSEDNMRYFNVMILGPTQSPYEGGVFKLELFLPKECPMAAPKRNSLVEAFGHFHLKNTFLVKTVRDRERVMNPGSVDFPETLPSLQLYFLREIVYAVVTPILQTAPIVLRLSREIRKSREIW
ncbi:hypothetical protein ACSBR1_001591 [Camellia fascicularis]